MLMYRATRQLVAAHREGQLQLQIHTHTAQLKNGGDEWGLVRCVCETERERERECGREVWTESNTHTQTHRDIGSSGERDVVQEGTKHKAALRRSVHHGEMLWLLRPSTDTWMGGVDAQVEGGVVVHQRERLDYYYPQRATPRTTSPHPSMPMWAVAVAVVVPPRERLPLLLLRNSAHLSVLATAVVSGWPPTAVSAQRSGRHTAAAVRLERDEERVLLLLLLLDDATMEDELQHIWDGV